MRTHLRHAHAEQRAVSPIIATILLVAITVVLAAVLYVLVGSIVNPGGTNGIPLGTALDLGDVEVGSGPAPTVWFENLSIESAASALTINSLSFSVQTSTNGIVAPPAGSTVQLISTETGLTLATYSFATASWTGGPLSTHPDSQDVLSLSWKQTIATDPLSGDRLITAGLNGYSGTLSNTMV